MGEDEKCCALAWPLLYQMSFEAIHSDILFVLFAPSVLRQIHDFLLRTEDMTVFDFKN